MLFEVLEPYKITQVSRECVHFLKPYKKHSSKEEFVIRGEKIMKRNFGWLIPLIAGILLILSFLAFPFIGLYTRFGMSAVLEVLLQVIIAFVAIFTGVILISSAISQRIHDYYRSAEVEKDEEEMEDEEDE